MSEVKNRSELEVVDRGPDWLFVRLRPDHEHLDDIAERLWKLMNQHFVRRLVLEMDEVDFLPSLLMGQLVMLHKRVLQHGGGASTVRPYSTVRRCATPLPTRSSLATFRLPRRCRAWFCGGEASLALTGSRSFGHMSTP